MKIKDGMEFQAKRENLRNFIYIKKFFSLVEADFVFFYPW